MIRDTVRSVRTSGAAGHRGACALHPKIAVTMPQEMIDAINRSRKANGSASFGAEARRLFAIALAAEGGGAGRETGIHDAQCGFPTREPNGPPLPQNRGRPT